MQKSISKVLEYFSDGLVQPPSRKFPSFLYFVSIEKIPTFHHLGGHWSSLKLRRDGASCVQSHRGSSALEQFRGRSSFGGATTDPKRLGGGRSGENSAQGKKHETLEFFSGVVLLCWAFNGCPANPFGRSELWI